MWDALSGLYNTYQCSLAIWTPPLFCYCVVSKYRMQPCFLENRFHKNLCGRRQQEAKDVNQSLPFFPLWRMFIYPTQSFTFTPCVSFQNGILHFCGFQVLPPQIFWCPAHSSPEVRKGMLDGWSARLSGLSAEKPLTFAPCELFNLNFQGGFLMRPEAREEQQLRRYGLTTGHHLWKPLPPDNQIKSQQLRDDSNAEPNTDN